MNRIIFFLMPLLSLFCCETLESNKNSFEVHVKIKEQRVTIIKNGDAIKQMVVSTGLSETPTPVGDFNLYEKKEFEFIPNHNVGVYYWSRFSGHISFHSILYNEKNEIIKSEADKLGNKASAGCVRLSTEDAKWIYETIPLGTRVIVQD